MVSPVAAPSPMVAIPMGPGAVMSSSAPPPPSSAGYSTPVLAIAPGMSTPLMIQPQQQQMMVLTPQRQMVDIPGRPGQQVAVVSYQPQAALALVPLSVQYAGIPASQLTTAQRNALRRESRLNEADKLPIYRRDWVRRQIIWEEDMANKWYVLTLTYSFAKQPIIGRPLGFLLLVCP
jgi:hypothetical protein